MSYVYDIIPITMTNNKSSEFSTKQQELASMAKVLSHPARIAIIQMLAEKKEIKTGDISEFLPLSRPTVSQHLQELKASGIIQGTIDGLKIHYCLDMKRLAEIQKKFDALFKKTISNFCCKC
jgi:ArsR family transcriptional regulator, arsenate/arsenite/antimonite-responsive transcriptional repressor